MWLWRVIRPDQVLRAYLAKVISRPIALAASALLLILFLPPPAKASSQESFTTPGLTAWTVPGGITELTVTAPSWYQSAGRNAGASCDAGWSPSWAQWPNSNTGGFVCNKEIYMTTTGTWSSRSRAAATLIPLRKTPTPVVISPRC